MSIRDLIIKRLETGAHEPVVEWLTYPRSAVKREAASWQDIAGRASRLAEILRSHARESGERAVIMLPNSRAYWVSFIACALSRTIAVPLFEASIAKGDRRRIDSVLSDCQPRFVLTNQRSLDELRALVGPETIVLDTAELISEPGGSEEIERCLALATAGPDDIAYLQYTSGSTSRPSGAVITHDAFEFNVRQSCSSLDITPTNRVVSWLPMHHDMGLIFAMGLACAAGVPVTCMTPDSFLRLPSRWIRELDCPEPAITGAPNFAYEYVVQRGLGKDYEGLDLSRVQWFLDGSEPVRPSAVQRFLQALAPYGLPPDAVRPSFGMAEATVFVSCAPGLKLRNASRRSLAEGAFEAPRQDSDAVELVSCGTIAEGTEHLVVAPDSLEVLPEGQVGELWLRGPSIAHGYWCGDERTGRAFQPLPGDECGPWLRTGDLVVMVAGELHVVGRLKAMLIVDGRNHYSEDLEHTVQLADPRIRPGRVAVVGEDSDQGEVPLVIAERRRHSQEEDNELVSLVRSELATNHGLSAARVALVSPGFIPLTTSGKIQRSLAHNKWRAHEAVATTD